MFVSVIPIYGGAVWGNRARLSAFAALLVVAAVTFAWWGFLAVAGVALDLGTDPCDLSAGEEGKGAKDARSEERVSTDVMVNMESPAFGRVSAFGHEFDVGYKNDLEIRFGLTKDNTVLTGFVLRVSLGR